VYKNIRCSLKRIEPGIVRPGSVANQTGFERRNKVKKKIAKPLIDELNARLRLPVPQPTGTVPGPAELDQDSGGGYNSNRTYPQT
jgi:hypothetical protein